MHGVELGVTGILVAVTVLTAVLASFLVGMAPDNGRVSTNCSDGNQCTVDRLYRDGHCSHEPLSRATACSDACYTSGHCNGQGACNGTATDCKGWCDTTNDWRCDNVFKWNINMVQLFSPTFPDPAVGTSCFANRCQAYAVFETLTDQMNGGGVWPVPAVQCKDLLDQDWWAANGTCIVVRDTAVDATYSDIVVGNADSAFRVCEYAWACAQWDDDAFQYWVDD